jgi:hypothetical protein
MNEAAGAASIRRNSYADSADAKNSKAKVHLNPVQQHPRPETSSYKTATSVKVKRILGWPKTVFCP